MRIDMQTGRTKLTCCSVYLPRAGYPTALLDEVCEQLLQTSTVARRSGSRIQLGADFNTQWGVGERGWRLAELATACDLHGANVDGDGCSDGLWTFRSSLGGSQED